MKHQSWLALIVVGLVFLLFVESKKLDPYKILGVDRNASQRQIQKAFHKLSLQYHPDKNKNKGAQEKFAEINNAYDILSDEQKRKNYDLYGDEKGNPGFDAGGHGGDGSYFTGGGPGGEGGFSFRPGDWQNMGGQEGSRSFSFSFGSSGSGGRQRSSGFGLDDIFSNFFGGGMGGGNQFGSGMGGGNQFGGFSSSGKSRGGSRRSSGSIPSVNSQAYRKQIVDSGITWLLLAYKSNLQGIQYYESAMEEVVTSLEGALKVGSMNCDSDPSLCKELDVHPRREPKILVYSYASNEKGSLVEYDGNVDAKSLRRFCQDQLPRFSKRISLDNFNAASEPGKLPKVLLMSTKKNTPVIWRALSGLYVKRFVFYDSEVHDTSHPLVRKLGIDSLPAIIGWMSNGEMQILKSGVSVKDLKSSIQELSGLLDGFEGKNNKAGSVKKDNTDSIVENIQLLTSSNFHDICSNKVPVCFIGVFRSSTTKEKLQKILLSVSQKTFTRQRSGAGSRSKDSVSYALLNASKHQSFLNSLDKSKFKSPDKLLVAYKPKRGTYATSKVEVIEEVEAFISSVLNGEIQFSKARMKPTLN